MTEIMDTIRGRRSVRSYLERDVTDEQLHVLFEAVQWAPSWANTQCWELVVIRDHETKRRLQETVSKGNPATKAVVTAPVLLGICGRTQSSGYYNGQVTTKFGDWMLFDLGLATQNLCLAAHGLGLGTVIVGLFDHDRAREILQVPSGYEVVALVPLGYPAKERPAPRRRPPAEFVHLERFGKD